MTHEETAALARKCQEGNKNAFGLLYEEYIRPIYNFIYYKTHHKETAEDLVSIVFMKGADNIKSFNPNKGHFSTWLYQIARNTVIDHYRTRRTHSDVEDAWDIDDGSDMAQDFDTKEKVRKVQEYLKELTSEQRDIMVMRVWQDMSYAEIAAILGKSEESCKMMFSRTIRKLRETMPVAVLAICMLGLFR